MDIANSREVMAFSNKISRAISEQNDWYYPRPQLRRENWECLNGPWRFRFDDELALRHPEEITEWKLSILVPFAPESEKSGIHDMGFHPCCWYERDVNIEKNSNRTLLHFGAVDYSCRVWVNNHFVGSHDGGHTPFCLDITEVLKEDGHQRISVRVYDDPQDLAKPRGKQDWELEPHSIWYPRTTGVWQTVWIEQVPLTRIDRLRWTPRLDCWEIGCEASIVGDLQEDLQLRVLLKANGQVLTDDSYGVVHGEVTRRIAFSDPGIDDFRNKLLWSPEQPTLIEAELRLQKDGITIDQIYSYTALRSVSATKDRFMLNGRPYYLRLILDQGYWSESLMTAPSSAAFKKDIELVKKMGFNGVRKHQKIEDPAFLYLADVMGLLVWEEMPSAYRFTHDSVERIVREWTDVIERDFSHPCIVVWVPFNESWGVPDLAEKATHQSCVQALYHLTKSLDPTRPVLGNDGWESTATDIIGIHDYDNDPLRFSNRYNSDMTATDVLGRRRPAGRLLSLDGHPHKGQPFILTEFGSIAYQAPEKLSAAWGYAVSQSIPELEKNYAALLSAVNRIELFSGFCYTQLTDTFQEANGLLFADRTPKFNLQNIASATHGQVTQLDSSTCPPHDPRPEPVVPGNA